MNRLARERCELAFAAYLESLKPGSPIENIPIFVRKGLINAEGQIAENPNELPAPSICVSVPKAATHDMGYPVCQLHVIVVMEVDEENAATNQANRFGFIAETLDEVNEALVRQAINAPLDSLVEDTRKVKGFNVFGYYQTEDMGKETERRWLDHLVYEVHCVPTDDLNGDGQEG